MAHKRRRPALSGPLGAALEAVGRALRDLPQPGMLIGGIAVILRGAPRLTRDIDATIAGGGLSLTEVLDRWRAYGLRARIADAVEFATEHQVLLLRHVPSGVDVDVSIAWLPFELEALAAAEDVDLGGLTLRLARAEDLMIYKAVAFRPQDQQDIERLLVLHGDHVDL
jgi:Nucleotidyltransferase of unknown function (DUF6036)